MQVWFEPDQAKFCKFFENLPDQVVSTPLRVVIFNFEAFAGRRGVEREETRGRNEGEKRGGGIGRKV